MQPARRARALPAALALVLLTSSCGGSSMEEAEMPTATAAADVGAVKAQLDRFRAIPAFTRPGPAFDATKLRGKTIFEIPITSEVPFIQAVEDGMRQAAATVGARVVVYPNQGRPSQWAQGIEAAIAEGADVITLFAQDPSLLGPQIARAERAGIPVIVVRTTGEGEPCQRKPAGEIYGTTCVPGPFEQAGRLEAAWVIAASNGRANVLVITSRDARSTAPLLRGLRGEFAAHCRSCRLRYVDVPIPEWASRLRTEVQSALVGDSKIDYIIPIYDSMAQFVVPAIVAAGAGKRVKIAAFNGTPFVLQMLQRGDIVEMDVGENLAWLGWATVDQAFRVLAGEKPASSEHTPLRVFNDGNVDEAGRPPRFDQGYGDAYVDGYKRLWGVADD